MELRPGLVVGKNVRLVRLLGEGGMGCVWVADHLTLQTEVAVKFISSELVKDEQALKRFTSEATASAQIKSPHVVQVFDHGVWSDLPYIVMELLVGEDLEGRIARGGPLSLEETALIVKQSAKALSQAHTLGIVHRDIKPANVFLTSPDGEVFVKLLDFGIAKRLTGENYAKTATGALIGTPYYMSPEQVMDDREIDFRADLWALAVVAYESLTGKLPFDGASLGAICVAINACQYKPVSSLARSLPPDIDRWFAKAFARNPEERFRSAKEFADALVGIGQSAYGWDMSTTRTNRVSMPSTPSWQTSPPPPPPPPPSNVGLGAPPPQAYGGYPQASAHGPAPHPPGALPPPAMPPGGAPHRSPTPLPGGMAAVSAAPPPPPPGYPGAPYAPPSIGVMPSNGPTLASSGGGRTTTPLSEVIPPGPWPAPSPSSPEMPSNPALGMTPPPGTWKARTDPLPPALPPTMDIHPKQTLGGTTMSDADPTRRKRRIAVALAGGIAVLGAIIAVVVTLTRAPAGPSDQASPGPETTSEHPNLLPPEPSVAPAVTQTVSPEPDPPPAVEPSPAPSGGASAAPADAKPKSTHAAPTSTAKPIIKPRRRDHGF
ncbi:MAG TPA: protein kinase [Polyangiaceae bacterium]|jgi:serine/threonine-protein kinase|nr:protein kinase [Polyangiaceae bacterium]